MLAAPGLQSGSGVPPLSSIHYFDPEAPIAFLSGDLPHWRQQAATYFVTFRLADSLPQEKLDRWREERERWMAEHPEPLDEATRRDYYERFPQRMQQWLDAGAGSCILARAEIKSLVEGALRHFNGERYRLDQFVVAPNHVHAIATPTGEHTLSEVLHSWKSYTSHEIFRLLKSGSKGGSGVPPLSSPQPQTYKNQSSLQSLNQSRDGSSTVPNKIWQKETFDHIVRSAASLERFRDYIRNHGLGKVAATSRR